MDLGLLFHGGNFILLKHFGNAVGLAAADNGYKQFGLAVEKRGGLRRLDFGFLLLRLVGRKI